MEVQAFSFLGRFGSHGRRFQVIVRFAVLGVCAVEMIVARKWGIEDRFSRF